MRPCPKPIPPDTQNVLAPIDVGAQLRLPLGETLTVLVREASVPAPSPCTVSDTGSVFLFRVRLPF